ncbi:MAG: cytochrome-c oxidase, cbb3-type subunit III [Burkholderiales bacterium PBB1]|nr:MAG: cytochrome-c oxidase, cbb3-type subunit III [Burkholderiales bacterium PBB1]
MSDFDASGWSMFVAVVSVVSMVACLVLLMIAARRRVMANDNTTGHVWDGDLTELNNPLPRWWMWLFILTVLFGFAYLVLYPGAGSYAGRLGWSSTAQHRDEQQRARDAMAPVYARYASADADTLMKDPAAMAIGERLFVNNCTACHGSDARGSKGFPNLTDDDWLHGGDHASIVKTITEGRVGMMPPLAAVVGDVNDLHNVAQYVLSLSGNATDPAAAAAGQAKFVVCAGCHGADGKGIQAIGSANLTDKIWLHGFGEEAIVAMVVNGKTNVMPAQALRLTPEQIHVLGAYVMSLSRKSPQTTP